MRLLAICNTPLQIIELINLVYEYHKDDAVDLIISDHISGSEIIVSNARKVGIFSNVYRVKTFNYSRRLNEFETQSKTEWYSDKILRNNNLKLDCIYDELLVSNVDPFADRVFERCVKYNKDIEVAIFEDGYSTYSSLGKEITSICEQENHSFFKKHVRNIYKIRRIACKIKKIYLMYPDRLVWKTDAKIVKVNQISRNNSELISILNIIFNYHVNENSFNKKYIYFEECYLKEGTPSLEPLFVDIISGVVGKDNLMVKRHPRVDINRYEGKGIVTNNNTYIPWELICLNEEHINDKVLITISSGSVSMPIDLCGIDVHSIVLKNMVDYGSNYYQNDYYKWLERYVYKSNKDNIFLPNTIDELKKSLLESLQ